MAVLSAWQWTRRFRQPACRFYPSCSQYVKLAIEKHGIAAGMRLGVVRICKCHPFHDGGVDEVPEVVCQGTPPCIARPMQIVMKSGLNPFFAGMKDRIFAQAFCLNTPISQTLCDMQDAKNAKNANNSTISDNSALSTISALSNNMLANTSRSA